MRFLKKWMGLFLFLGAEIGLYRWTNISIDIASYAFFWITIAVFLLLLKIFNLNPTSGANSIGRTSQDAYAQLSSSFLDKHIKPSYRKHITSKLEDNHEIVEYLILIAINGLIMYFGG